MGANAAINRNIAIYDRFIINTSDDVYVFGLDAETGELAWETGPAARVIAAHDARTGEELWCRRTIPGPGEPGDETWGGVPFEKRRHVGTWMPPSYDHELRLAYEGTSVTEGTICSCLRCLERRRAGDPRRPAKGPWLTTRPSG